MKIYMYVYIISYIATVINKNILAMFGLEKIWKFPSKRSMSPPLGVKNVKIQEDSEKTRGPLWTLSTIFRSW